MPAGDKPAASEVVIQTVDLHKSFGDNEVLRGINLEFRAGTTTVILGGSGSGKSVLMKHLIGLIEPDRGKVLVEGQDIAGIRGEARSALRAKFGMVFQWAALFDSMTVGDNVAFPRSGLSPCVSSRLESRHWKGSSGRNLCGAYTSVSLVCSRSRANR